jgi:hypothetical protein
MAAPFCVRQGCRSHLKKDLSRIKPQQANPAAIVVNRRSGAGRTGDCSPTMQAFSYRESDAFAE